MNQYEMVAIIVLVAVAGGVLKSIFSSRSERFNDQARQAQGDDLKQKKQQQHIKQLEQRIEVLEAIVTSDGYELKQHFKDLNSKQQETK